MKKLLMLMLLGMLCANSINCFFVGKLIPREDGTYLGYGIGPGKLETEKGSVESKSPFADIFNFGNLSGD